MSLSSRRSRMVGVATAGALAAVALVGPLGSPAQAATYNYTEALQKSIMFYEAQQSGRLPSWNRVQWRGDATVNDGKAAGVDLSGGWYDAGDHVKFGFPMAFATTMLAWGLEHNRAGFVSSKQLTPMVNNLRWATDYLIAAHPSPNTLYVQVGDGSVDHAYWGPPEVIDKLGQARPVAKIDTTCRGTDVAAETAASMAASAVALRPYDAAYADKLVTHAQQLMGLAETPTNVDGKENAYVNCVKAAQGYYTSTFEGGTANPGATKMYWDELAWGSLWLYRATNDSSWLTKAKGYYPKMGTESPPGGGWSDQVPAYSFGLGWNDKEYGVYVLMAALTGEQQYRTDAQRYLDYWTVGYNGKKGKYTPGGLAFIFYWASLRMSAGTSWAALVYADYLGKDDPLYARYHDFAKRQIDYALGDNPAKRSYMVGFGVNPPTHVHHRAASGQSLGYMSDPSGPNRHTIYGALAGGPDDTDGYVDDRSDYQRNEVAVDYNSSFTAALARLAAEYGGSPVPDSALVDPQRDAEMSVGLLKDFSGPDGSSYRLQITNMSGWPPRILSKASLRFYITLDGSTTASQVSVTSGQDACKTGPLQQYKGAVWYANLDCSGLEIYPGSTSTYQKTTSVNFKVTGGAAWDPANDWSAGGSEKVQLFDDGVLVWGSDPDGTTPKPTTSSPRPTTTTPVPTTTSPEPTTSSPTTTKKSSTKKSSTRKTSPKKTSTKKKTSKKKSTKKKTTKRTRNAAGQACEAELVVTDSWGTGYRAQISVTALRSLTGWAVSAPATGTALTQSWGGSVVLDGGSLSVRPASAVAARGAGTTAVVGFTATGDASAAPTALACQG
ncbi:MAG: glycoside hydrolase family 9 protein [Kineosporiaceae bacterium]